MAKMKAVMAAHLVMEKEGVTQAFGVPGAAINPLYSVMRERGTIAHVLARHVEGASHMAEGYTRAKAGNIGVCIGTSGPAGTDMITGLYSAIADSIPILCITGQAPRARLYKEDFQAVDIESISKPVTKWSVTVQYDIYHMQRMEGELAATISKHLARIAHIQLADNPGRTNPARARSTTRSCSRTSTASATPARLAANTSPPPTPKPASAGSRRRARAELLRTPNTEAPRHDHFPQARFHRSGHHGHADGGELGAKAASLTIMVGGPEAAFGRVKPLFELMGKNITLVGGVGAGQTCKVANQIIVALPQTAGAAQLMQVCAANGMQNLDHSALVKALELMADHKVMPDA